MTRIVILFSLIVTTLSNAHAQSWPDDFLNNLVMRASSCCVICTAGKACGNSCISKSFNCSKGSGCACNSGSVPDKPKENDDKNKNDKNKDPIVPNNEDDSKDDKVICPKIIARKDVGTYSKKKNFLCFKKAIQAENAGFLEDPINFPLLNATSQNTAKVKCPKIIADKRSELFATKKHFACFEKAKDAKVAGYIKE